MNTEKDVMPGRKGVTKILAARTPCKDINMTIQNEMISL